MTKSVTVSVVVTAYNRAALIGETLNRILSQTRKPDEVIVVNDGSTDETSLVLSKYENRVQVVDIENSGDMAAKNVGLEQASGDVVAYCDSDDLWMPEYLGEMLRFWDLLPNLKAAYSDFYEVRDGVWQKVSKFRQAPAEFWDGWKTLEGEHGILNRSYVTRLLQYQPFFPSCMLVNRRWFLAAGGWDESVGRVVGCDFATHLRLIDEPPIGVLRRPLVGIRKHAQNFSGDNLRMALGDAHVLQTLLDKSNIFDKFRNEIRRSIQSRQLAALVIAYARGDLDLVRELGEAIDQSVLQGAHRLKYAIAGLPRPLRSPLWRATVLAGTAKARFHGKKRATH